MSLKAFHVFFIAVSMLMALFVGTWGVQQFMVNDSFGGLALGIFFFVFGLVLLVYGLKFVAKIKDLGI